MRCRWRKNKAIVTPDGCDLWIDQRWAVVVNGQVAICGAAFLWMPAQRAANNPQEMA
jgi:hypothetical protein